MNLSKENEKIFALQVFLKSCYIGFMIFDLNSFSQRLKNFENFELNKTLQLYGKMQDRVLIMVTLT